MSTNSPDPLAWLVPFDEIFLGLDETGAIQRALGATDSLPGLTELCDKQGSTWLDCVDQLADESAREGLRQAWQAIAHQRVAPAHWPALLPFKGGLVARLRRVTDQVPVAWVVHLSPRIVPGLYQLFSTIVFTSGDRLVRLSQHAFSGVDGPLTDQQVKGLRNILTNAEYLHHLLGDLCAEILAPASTAPLPAALAQLFTFSARDFTDRRITTQRLNIQCRWSAAWVYCPPSIRTVIQRLLQVLIAGIAIESTITLSDTPCDDPHVVQVELWYHSQEPNLRVEQRLEPLGLADAARLQVTSHIHRLITTAQAHLKPVNGRVWAEPYQAEGVTARAVLVLPRWQSEPASPKAEPAPPPVPPTG